MKELKCYSENDIKAAEQDNHKQLEEIKKEEEESLVKKLAIIETATNDTFNLKGFE